MNGSNRSFGKNEGKWLQKTMANMYEICPVKLISRNFQNENFQKCCPGKKYAKKVVQDNNMQKKLPGPIFCNSYKSILKCDN